MANSNDIFDKLAVIVGAPGSKRFAKILEAMMSPEEAEISIELQTPMTTEQLAKKLNKDPESLQAMIDDMVKRQIIRKTPNGYVTPNSVVGFHHGAIGWMREELKSKVYPLWGDFFYAEWRDIIVDGFEKRKKTGAPGAHRIVPAYKALIASPKVKPEQVLWYEDMRQILKRAYQISLMMCGCRGLWRKCDNPVDVCIKLEFPTGGKMPRKEASDFLKPPIDVNYEQAMKVVDECEDRGLVHVPLNTSQGDLYCNCCDDCCMVINPCLNRGNVHEILTPSRYRAVVDESLCVGCQKCVKRCKFSAITMKGSDPKKLKSVIDPAKCLGCGACVVSCPKHALTFELVRPPDHIPTCSVMELFMWKQPPVKK